MENEELILNFMQITNLPIEDAKQFLQAAGNKLEVAIQNYYDSNQSAFPQDVQQNPPAAEQEEEVRPALPREYSQLVEEDSVRNVQLARVRQQFSSSFRDLKREMEIQEEIASGRSVPKRKCLEDIYRNPIDITYNIDLHNAKRLGQSQGKWIALLINDESFPSLCFNRDIFNIDPTSKVKQLIKKNFILLRKNANGEESLKIIHNYNLIHREIPIFLIIDSLTGELKKDFGETKNLTLKKVVKELKKYSSSKDKQLVYNSEVETDSDDDIQYPSSNFTATSSNSSKASHQPPTSQKPSATNTKAVESDEESFASLDSDDVQNDHDEPKVLEPEEEISESETETQTNIMLKLQDQNHNFKYPSKRTVANLINYIYRNYLVQTGIYDDQRKRFSLFSRLHNKCLTNLDQSQNLEEAKIHPSCVLMHNAFDKE